MQTFIVNAAYLPSKSEIVGPPSSNLSVSSPFPGPLLSVHVNMCVPKQALCACTYAGAPRPALRDACKQYISSFPAAHIQETGFWGFRVIDSLFFPPICAQNHLRCRCSMEIKMSMLQLSGGCDFSVQREWLTFPFGIKLTCKKHRKS